MNADVAHIYQYATTIITKASLFLNVMRPSMGGQDDPSQNLRLTTSTQETVSAELIRQLKDSNIVSPSAIGLIFATALPIVLDGANQGGQGSLLGFVGTSAALPFKLIRDVVTGKDPLGEIQSLPGELRGALSQMAPSLFHLSFLLVNQVEVALSVLPTLQMFKQSEAAMANVEKALGDYFFTDGFATIDGDRISRPQFTDVATGDLRTLKSLVSQKSGADFVRNAVRIPIEAGADVEYDLQKRLAHAMTKVFGAAPTATQHEKLRSWMKGFASNAESTTTAAVEALVLGAGAAQSNSLIGAASGTAAGTIARKATQHVFLRELGV